MTDTQLIERPFLFADPAFRQVAAEGNAWPSRAFLPPLPEDEADRFNAGELGHEKIERAALAGVVGGNDRLRAIYFGNWQRDMSQFIAPIVASTIGANLARPIYDLLFGLLDVMAEAEFGRRLDRVRFGAYRWEEHIDNPRDFGIALNPASYDFIPGPNRRPEDQPEAPYPDPRNAPRGVDFWREGPGAIPRYILTSRHYVLSQLETAMRLGPDQLDRRGLEHFGNAMHTVEDFFAHSNFLEIARFVKHGVGNPKTGYVAGDQGRTPIPDSLKRPRLTTGVFLAADTASSIEKFLMSALEGKPSGSPPSNLRRNLTRVFVRRLLGENMLRVYDGLISAWQKTGIPALVEPIQRQIEELITRPIRLAIVALLRPMSTAVASLAGGTVFSDPSGRRIVEITHTELSKDDPHLADHALACDLAAVAVRAFWAEMVRVWSTGAPSRSTNAAGTAFGPLIERFMNHPLAPVTGGWWEPLISRSSPRPVPSSALRPRSVSPRPPARPPARPPVGARPTLRRGSSGPAVRFLQGRLNALMPGQSTRLAVDGRFGPRTEAAVRSFQRARRIKSDGVVGPITWNILSRG